MTDPDLGQVETLEAAAPESTAIDNRWLSEGRSLGDELRRPRYTVVALVALAIILLEIWVLF